LQTCAGAPVDLLELVRQDTRAEFRQAATTKGGEHKGPCPLCGGQDRFCVWPNDNGKARFWCRQCDVSGDLADYLELVRHMPHLEALKAAGVVDGEARISARNKSKTNEPERPIAANVYPPCAAWQARARAFVEYARGQLWGDAGRPALEYLRAERRLADDAIRHYRLGYYPPGPWKFNHDPKVKEWGQEREKWITLPEGIVIPCEVGGVMWYVKVRRPHMQRDGALDNLSAYLEYVSSWEKDGETVYNRAKYTCVTGSEGVALFGADDMRGTRELLLCEGEFDAMLAWQGLQDLIDVAAIKPGPLGFPGRWALLMLPYKVLLAAYDMDAAGVKDAATLAKVSKRARRVRVPEGSDLTDFVLSGGDLRAWYAFQLATVEGNVLQW